MQQDIWYYAQNNQRQGPVTLEELRVLCGSGRVSPGDLVWTVGMEQWQAAGEAAALVGAFPGSVAPGAPAMWAGSEMAGPQPLPPPEGYRSDFAQPLDYAQPNAPAGFWMRVAAYLIDYMITGFAGCLVGGVFGGIIGVISGMQGQSYASKAEPLISCGSGMLGLTISWLYYAMMESSSKQATLGKMALGLKVTDLDGQRVTFGRASGRFFGKIVSALILLIGFMMAGWTEKKQALHDMMAGTLVVRK